MAKVLITGASGLLGKYLIQENQHHQITGTWFTNHYGNIQLDICNQSQARYVFDKVKPDVVIHCAAISNVDYVERNYAEAYNVNIIGTRIMLELSEEHRAKFVLISSNAVFRGDNPPYNEISDRQPVNRYGAMKREAETLVMAARDYLIFRPMMLYGYPHLNGRNNPLTIFEPRLFKDKPVKAVDDIYWQPASAKDAARIIWQLLEYKNEVFNLAPDETLTLYDFAVKLAKHLSKPKKLVEAVPNSFFNLPAPRPVNTSYDVSKLRGLGIRMLKVDEGLE